MTIAKAVLVRPGNQHNIDSLTVATPSGTVKVSEEGNVIVYQGLKLAAVGDPARYDNQDIYDVDKDSTVFAIGQTVYWDPVNTIPALFGLIRIGRCVKAAASGDATVRIRLLKDASLQRYASITASTALTTTTTATVFDRNVSVPANYLQAGDVLRVRAQVIATITNSTDTLTLALMLGAQSIIATAAVDVADNDIGFIDADITVRTIGATGTIVAAGMQALGTPGTVTSKPAILASTTIDTTAAQTLGIRGTWSTNNAGNSCRLDVLNVQLFRG